MWPFTRRVLGTDHRKRRGRSRATTTGLATIACSGGCRGASTLLLLVTSEPKDAQSGRPGSRLSGRARGVMALVAVAPGPTYAVAPRESHALGAVHAWVGTGHAGQGEPLRAR
jgi:hypothetical protein